MHLVLYYTHCKLFVILIWKYCLINKIPFGNSLDNIFYVNKAVTRQTQQRHQRTISVGTKQDHVKILHIHSPLLSLINWLENVTCKPSTRSKNQDIVFFEQVLGFSRDSTVGTTTHHRYCWSTYEWWHSSGATVRVHWQALRILELGTDIYYIF